MCINDEKKDMKQGQPIEQELVQGWSVILGGDRGLRQAMSLSLFQRIIKIITVGHSVWSVSADNQTFANLHSLKVHPYWVGGGPIEHHFRMGSPPGQKESTPDSHPNLTALLTPVPPSPS